jgi:hypothetical protein
MATSEQIKQEKQKEPICEICGRTMELIVIRKKKNQWDKGHKMFQCVESCGNIRRKRTFNELLRDLGERE